MQEAHKMYTSRWLTHMRCCTGMLVWYHYPCPTSSWVQTLKRNQGCVILAKSVVICHQHLSASILSIALPSFGQGSDSRAGLRPSADVLSDHLLTAAAAAQALWHMQEEGCRQHCLLARHGNLARQCCQAEVKHVLTGTSSRRTVSHQMPACGVCMLTSHSRVMSWRRCAQWKTVKSVRRGCNSKVHSASEHALQTV